MHDRSAKISKFISWNSHARPTVRPTWGLQQCCVSGSSHIVWRAVLMAALLLWNATVKFLASVECNGQAPGPLVLFWPARCQHTCFCRGRLRPPLPPSSKVWLHVYKCGNKVPVFESVGPPLDSLAASACRLTTQRNTMQQVIPAVHSLEATHLRSRLGHSQTSSAQGMTS